ncbi:eukaryotic cytochrome b561 domain-containing protein [Ditylenchus destructor]|uniref:Eukaryotic cytochrome b561 domain-containing protein n=1 Tax=Ditylenchus destructor TaxID=166010 RepID=A0AAD4R307_9BILA|nr:eukaryotic cytochrome b561 domain-containing protein [Ditylenchus destructor]
MWYTNAEALARKIIPRALLILTLLATYNMDFVLSAKMLETTMHQYGLHTIFTNYNFASKSYLMAYESYALNGSRSPIPVAGDENRRGQYPVFAAIGLVGCWMGFYKGGFGFQDEPKKEFRWHPLLMSTALLLINGEAILIYRGFRSVRKIYTKAIHGTLQLCAFIIVLAGLKAVFDSHDLNKDPQTGEPKPIANLYSIHSWVGLFAVSLFAVQWIGGCVAFFIPGFSMGLRTSGIAIFVISLGAALMGATELSVFSIQGTDISTERLLANLYAVIIVSYAAVVLSLVVNPKWIRVPLPSETLLPVVPTS